MAAASRMFARYRPVRFWLVRYFKSLDQEEAQVAVHPETGAVLGFQHVFPEDRAGADIGDDAARGIGAAFAAALGQDTGAMDLKESRSEKKPKRARPYAGVGGARGRPAQPGRSALPRGGGSGGRPAGGAARVLEAAGGLYSRARPAEFHFDCGDRAALRAAGGAGGVRAVGADPQYPAGAGAVEGDARYCGRGGGGAVGCGHAAYPAAAAGELSHRGAAGHVSRHELRGDSDFGDVRVPAIRRGGGSADFAVTRTCFRR